MRSTALCVLALLAACDTGGTSTGPLSNASSADGAPVGEDGAGERFTIRGSDGRRLVATALARFDTPWALDFLPDGRLLVSQRSGGIWLLHANGRRIGPVDDAPTVHPRNQGGMGDVLVHPRFDENALVYLSYVERDGALSGAAVERARLALRADGARLVDREVIWRQVPKVTGNGHYGHRLAFSADGHLFISSGERQKFTPAQDLQSNLGKVLRLHGDGSIPADNPFADRGGVTAQIWSLGHRNPLGLAFDAAGRLFEVEMGPRGGDELNLVGRAANYGYPEVSEGRHYNGRDIPDHATRPAFRAPLLAWTPVISPAGLAIYAGEAFADWSGDALVAGLSGRALVRVALSTVGADDAEAGRHGEGIGKASASADAGVADGASAVTAREVARYRWGARVRGVRVGPDGAVYVLEDGRDGRLLRLTPATGGAR